MKIFAVILAALIATSAAVPAPGPEKSIPLKPESRIVLDIVSSAIESLSELLRNIGLDPFTVTTYEQGLGLPVANLFRADAGAKDVRVTGLSEIVINRINFAILSQRLTFDISLPEIALSVGDAAVNLIVLSENIDAHLAGKVDITNVGVSGTARVGINLATGITVRDLQLNFYIGGLSSNLHKLSLLGTDVSKSVNEYINNELYNSIVDHQKEISEMLEIVAWEVIDLIL